jgi:hypothetical protein
MKAGIVWSQSEGGSQHALAFAFLTEVAVQFGEVDSRRRILGLSRRAALYSVSASAVRPRRAFTGSSNIRLL